MAQSWQQLYDQAVDKCCERQVSTSINSGGVSAVIETKNGNMYSGVSVDTACSIGYCAERNAIGNMLTNKENIINRLVTVKGEKLIMPCGVCREFMMQLSAKSAEIEILTSLNPIKTIKLSKLLPNYWQ